MATPHIEAAPGTIADTVLLPGDPLRARFVAEAVLEDAVQVNALRNMLAFTGRWQGRPVTVPLKLKFPPGTMVELPRILLPWRTVAK